MIEQTEQFLEGRLSLTRLTKDRDSLGRFQTQDDRGQAALFHSGSPVSAIEYVTFEPNTTRGLHYHEFLTEFAYVCQGRLLLAARLVDRGEQVNLSLITGDLLTIHPGIAHALRAVEMSILVASYQGDQDPIKDKIRYNDLTFPID